MIKYKKQPLHLAISVELRNFALIIRKQYNQNHKSNMLIVPVKEGENIERALKKFKRKFDKTGVGRELRARKEFRKPSVKRRLKMEHAVYVQQLRQAED